MSVLIDAIEPHIARGLFTTRGHVEQSLDDLIGQRGGFYPTQITVPPAWDFDFNASDKVSHFLAYGCGRFACASFQSYLKVVPDLTIDDRLPWALIQAYYSAFYAGHSILRALGCACTYVDGSRAAVVRKVLSAYGSGGQFDGGLYSASLSQSGNVLRFLRLGVGIGGIHELFWQLFAIHSHAEAQGSVLVKAFLFQLI